MPEHIGGNRRGWVFWLTFALLMVFVIYPLSIGPAFWWAHARSLRRPFLPGVTTQDELAIYGPLIFMAKYSGPTVRGAFGDYLAWWAGTSHIGMSERHFFIGDD